MNNTSHQQMPYGLNQWLQQKSEAVRNGLSRLEWLKQYAQNISTNAMQGTQALAMPLPLALPCWQPLDSLLCRPDEVLCKETLALLEQLATMPEVVCLHPPKPSHYERD